MKPMRICLNMIVKDESHIIGQTLEHLRKYICYWVISDTGSTDNTKEIIRNFGKKYKIPGHLVDHKWEDFGTNRTLALQACLPYVQHFDYIWVFDADDLVVGNLKFPQINKKINKNPDYFSVKFGTGFTYMRNQIFKATEKWRYVGVLHEYPECISKKAAKGVNIEGDYYIDSRRLGARNKISQEEKYLKDAAVLEKGLIKEPNNARYMFYLAQSYMDAGKNDKAIEWYQKRVKAGQWFEEVYYSLYRIATCSARLNKPWPEIEKLFLDAWKYLPSRAEPLYEIAKYYRLTGDFQKGYKYAKLGSTIPFPKDQVLFLFKSVYDWQVHDELMICASKIGKYEEALQIGEKLIKERTFPDDQFERIFRNLQGCKMSQDIEKHKIEDIFKRSEEEIFQYVQELHGQKKDDLVIQVVLRLLEKYKLDLNSPLRDIENIELRNKLLDLYYMVAMSGANVLYKKHIVRICDNLLYSHNIFNDEQREDINNQRRLFLPYLSDLLHLKSINIDLNKGINPSLCVYNGSYYLYLENNLKSDKNFLLELDENFQIKRPIEFNKPVELQNIRLFTSEDKLKFCAEFGHDEASDIVQGEIASNGIIQADIMRGEDTKFYEKNWLPFVEAAKTKYLRSHNPLIVMTNKEMGSEKKLEKEREKASNINCKWFNNAAGPLLYRKNTGENMGEESNEENYYLCLVQEKNRHIKSLNKSNYYKFVLYDKEWNLMKVSLPFKFHGEMDVCNSMTYSIDANKVLFAVGLEDKTCKIYSVYLTEIEDILYVPTPYILIT